MRLNYIVNVAYSTILLIFDKNFVFNNLLKYFFIYFKSICVARLQHFYLKDNIECKTCISVSHVISKYTANILNILLGTMSNYL